MFGNYRVYDLTTNPFPADAYARDDDSDLFVDAVVEEELQAFRARLIAGAVVERRSMSFLWSLGGFGADTGYGKTATLKRMAKEINADLGHTTLMKAGATDVEAHEHPICATYVSFNAKETNGLYAGLFEAVRSAATLPHGSGTTLLWHLRQQALARNGSTDADTQLRLPDIIEQTHYRFGRGLGALRPDFVDIVAEATDADTLANALTRVSLTTRQRAGHLYFQAFLCLAAAAGIMRVFAFLDQLEDLADPSLTTKQKRFREVARFRDTLIEDPIIGKMGSFVLTLHRRAEDALLEAWQVSRLPSFDPQSKTNLSRLVILRGLRNDTAAETLAAAFLEQSRTASAPDDQLWPFTADAIHVMRVRNSGRISQFLLDCHDVLAHAADSSAQAPLDGAFVEDVAAPQTADETPGAAYATHAALRGERAGDEVLGGF